MAYLLIEVPDKWYESVKQTGISNSEILSNAIKDSVCLSGKTNGEVSKNIFGIGSKQLNIKTRDPSWWNSIFKGKER